MTREPDDKIASEDEAIESLLGALGPRADVPAETMEQVRHTVHAEWRALVGARRRRRRLFAYGLAASGLIAVMVTFALFMTIGNRGPVATVARVIGTLEASDEVGGAWRRLSVGESIKAGQVLRTSVDGRAALTQSAGIHVRLDASSLIEFDSARKLSLSAGAVYVDADPAVTAKTSFAVETLLGSVSHVGTQFEVRSRGRMLEINVREGSVRLRSATGENFAHAGEQLRVTDSSIERRALSLQDPAWQWALQVAPEYAIDGVSLAEFLRWVSRETGRELVYMSPQAADAARTLVLHGSIGALPPDVAMQAVLSTTRLAQAQTRADAIGITFKAAPNTSGMQPAQ
ncbi:MAG: FecR family protein [Steroidobacteraceae bacterium]